MAKRKEPEQESMWDRMPGETPREYQKFCAYRDMNTAEKPIRTRSMAKLAKDIGFSQDHLRKISAKNEWVSRCAAYDAHLDEKAREQNEVDIMEMRKNHALLASQMIKKAAKRLLTITEDEITATDIVRLVDVGVKIERLSRGESTENKQISGEAKITHQGEVTVRSPGDLNLSSLSDKELTELEQLLEKLHTEPDV
jgi:hypothetical protein